MWSNLESGENKKGDQLTAFEILFVEILLRKRLLQLFNIYILDHWFSAQLFDFDYTSSLT